MGTGAGTGYPSLMGASETVMQSGEAISERILYWLWFNTQVQALAERLLQRFAVTVSDLPASAAHLDENTAAYIGISLEVAFKALEGFPCGLVAPKTKSSKKSGIASTPESPMCWIPTSVWTTEET
jgi:hypothetical protein